jgi:hypothetical protein
MVTTTNTSTYNSTLAATGRLRYFRYVASTTDADPTTYVYRAHISDLAVKRLSGDITSATSNTITISDTSGRFSTRVANLYNGMILSIDSGPGVGQTRIIETYDTSTKVLKLSSLFNVLPTSASKFSIKFGVKDIESIVLTDLSSLFTPSGSYTIYGSAEIDRRSKIGGFQTNDTFITDPGDSELIFPLGNPYVSSVSDTSYVSSRTYRGQTFTTTTVGVTKTVAIETAAQSVLNFIRTNATESVESVKQNFIVMVTDPLTNANLSFGQIVPFATTASAGLNRTVSVNSAKTAVTFYAQDLQPFSATIFTRLNVIGGDNINFVKKVKTLGRANTYGLGITGTSGTVNTNTLIDLDYGQIYINNSSAIVKNGLPQSLYVSDVKRIVKIVDPGAATPTLSMLSDPEKDVTNNFTFDNGQRDTYYGHASISLKPGYPVPTRLWILFDHYNHSGGDGYFDVTSYSGNEDYAEIGVYKSSSGIEYKLRDCIDFRPAIRNVQSNLNTFKYTVTPTPSNFVGFLLAEDETSFTSDYSYYLGRKDLLVLTKDSVIKLIEGTPSISPLYPPEEANSLVLAKLVYDPYTAYIPGEYPGVIPNLSIIPVPHKTWLMKDISGLNSRIENLEYYTSLNLLEQSTSSLQIQDDYGLNRFKNGILVDNFKSYSVGDTFNTSYFAQINTKDGTLSPATVTESFHLYNKDFDPVVGKPISVDRAIADLNYHPHKVGNSTHVFTLPYTTKELVVQKLASRTVNINSFNARNIEGVMVISPAIDTWIDIYTPPSSQGTQGSTEGTGSVTVIAPPPEYLKIGPIPGSTLNAIFTSNNPPSGSAAVYTSQQNDAGEFRNQYGVWGYPDLGRTNKTFNRTYTVTFTKSGYYLFEGSVDDTGTVTLDGNNVFGALGMGYAGGATTVNGFGTNVYAPSNVYSTSIYVAAGNHTLYYDATNTIDIGCMALRISYYGDSAYVIFEQVIQY